jgi:hypothetical protein
MSAPQQLFAALVAESQCIKTYGALQQKFDRTPAAEGLARKNA